METNNITFSEFVTNWFRTFIEEANYSGDVPTDLFELFECDKEDFEASETTIEDYLVSNCEAETIYENLFAWNAKHNIKGVPDAEEFVTQMLMNAVDGNAVDRYDEPLSFVKEFVEDMASHIINYSLPLGFFKDLQNGCQSGMIGMLVYNDDCKRIYIEHIDDLEGYKEDMEESLGEPIRSRIGGLPHYTFMTWLCYEELGFNIARNLYPDEF